MSGNGNGNGRVTHDPENDWGNIDEWERERLEEIKQRRAALRAAAERDRATLPPTELAEGLTERLGVDALGLQVTTVEVFGRGPDARVDVHLSDGSRPLRFDRYADMSKPTTLTSNLATQLGVIRTFKVPEALGVVAMVFQLARHHNEAGEDEFAQECGLEYLRVAPVQEFDADDQADRWRAFSALAKLSPARAAGDDRSAYGLAVASVVLAERATGQRWVRAGWFLAYVKREAAGLYSPASLATQMQRVGWKRPNSEGRIKATSPMDGQKLGWAFYLVDPDWESGQVPAGSASNARVHAHARGIVDTPAGTPEPEGGEDPC